MTPLKWLQGPLLGWEWVSRSAFHTLPTACIGHTSVVCLPHLPKILSSNGLLEFKRVLKIFH